MEKQPDGEPEKNRTPEERLMIAILIRATKDLFDSSKEIREHALAFWECNDDISWSLNWICDYLKLNTAHIKKYIADNKHNLREADLRYFVYNR